MEDKHIFKGEFVYSIRVDCPKFTEATDVFIRLKMSDYFPRACFARENKKDGMPHYQGIAWRDTKLPSEDNSTIRTTYKQKWKLKGTNRIALTSARKVKSLAAYCNDKEKKGVISWGIKNLSILGKWENNDAVKERLKDKLIDELKEMKSEPHINPWMMCEKACEVYDGYRPPPFKTLLQLGRSTGYIPQRLFINLYYKDLQFLEKPTFCRTDYIEEQTKIQPTFGGAYEGEIAENTIVSYLECDSSDSEA